MKSIMDWQKEVHGLAIEKGWYDGTSKRTPLEMHALIASEIGEATNEARKNVPEFYQVQSKNADGTYNLNLKPEGECVELADAVIRILDYFQYRGWDLEQVMQLKHNFNRLRPLRHGGKKY